MKVPSEIQSIIRQRRKKAILVFALFAVLQIPFVLMLVLKFNTTTQFVFILTEVLLFWAVLKINKSGVKLISAFSPIRQGKVLKEQAEIERHQKKGYAFGGQSYTIVAVTVVSLLIETEQGNVYEIRLKSSKQMGIFKAGDEVLFSKALAAPILINRVGEKYVCPNCGAMFANNGEGNCHSCNTFVITI